MISARPTPRHAVFACALGFATATCAMPVEIDDHTRAASGSTTSGKPASTGGSGATAGSAASSAKAGASGADSAASAIDATGAAESDADGDSELDAASDVTSESAPLEAASCDTTSCAACSTCAAIKTCATEYSACVVNVQCSTIEACVGLCAGNAACVESCKVFYPFGVSAFDSWNACRCSACSSICTSSSC